MKRIHTRDGVWGRGAGFTLVEILIVVVILGILAAIVVPQFVGAQREAAEGTTYSELQKLRRAIDVYQARHENALPDVTEGDGTWGALVAGNGEYLKSAPLNPYVGGANARRVLLRDSPDDAYQTAYGWVFNATTGEVWAGSFDGNDEPIPRP
ncbi:MAG: type II secretion system protein [Phycisphaerales bacterium JB059]